MKVESIELSWFRGAGEAASLDLHTKSMVVYGANGAGKSSFADAFEYLISNGKIKHLAHEYSGVHQQRGLRNTHAPEGMEAKITLHFQGQAWMSASIRPDGVAKFQCQPATITSEVQSWDLARFILRQDEVAHFIHATKSEKYSVLLPLLGLDTLEYSWKQPEGSL
jgi:recombinational DNA repair ATPase RecF